MFFKRSSRSVPLSDAELLRQFRESGDAAYAGELFQRYQHLVFGTCMKYLKNEEESKDAAMHVFEKLLVELTRHDIVHFSSWLHTLTKNHCLMHLRSAKTRFARDVFSSDPETAMENGSAAHLTENDYPEETLQAVEQGVAGLPPEQKQCIDLFYFQEKSYKEIVEITGYDLKKVKSYIQNGKRNLKIYLTNENES